MTYYQPILEDIIELPDDIVIPKTLCPFMDIYLNSNVLINITNGLVSNLYLPTIKWEYDYVIGHTVKREIIPGYIIYEWVRDYDGAERKYEYYRLRQKYERKLEGKKLSIFDLKEYYSEFQDEFLSKKDKQEFIYTQRMLLQGIRRLQKQFSRSLPYIDNVSAFLLNNGQLIKLKPKRND